MTECAGAWVRDGLLLLRVKGTGPDIRPLRGSGGLHASAPNAETPDEQGSRPRRNERCASGTATMRRAASLLDRTWPWGNSWTGGWPSPPYQGWRRQRDHLCGPSVDERPQVALRASAGREGTIQPLWVDHGLGFARDGFARLPHGPLRQAPRRGSQEDRRFRRTRTG